MCRAGATLTASFDTGDAGLLLPGSICQTDPATGQCLAAPAGTVTLDYPGGAVETFTVFLQAVGPIQFEPGFARVFVRFKDADGGDHGSISVAVRTN